MAFEVMKRTHGSFGKGISIGGKTITLPTRYVLEMDGGDASWAIVYYDAKTHKIAVELLETQENSDARKLMRSTSSFTRQIHIEGLIHRERIRQYQYNIQAKIENIHGKRMLVFPVEVEAEDDKDLGELDV